MRGCVTAFSRPDNTSPETCISWAVSRGAWAAAAVGISASWAAGWDAACASSCARDAGRLPSTRLSQSGRNCLRFRFVPPHQIAVGPFAQASVPVAASRSRSIVPQPPGACLHCPPLGRLFQNTPSLKHAGAGPQTQLCAWQKTIGVGMIRGVRRRRVTPRRFRHLARQQRTQSGRGIDRVSENMGPEASLTRAGGGGRRRPLLRLGNWRTESPATWSGITPEEFPRWLVLRRGAAGLPSTPRAICARASRHGPTGPCAGDGKSVRIVAFGIPVRAAHCVLAAISCDIRMNRGVRLRADHTRAEPKCQHPRFRNLMPMTEAQKRHIGAPGRL